MTKNRYFFFSFGLIVSLFGPHLIHSTLSLCSLFVLVVLFFERGNFVSPIVFFALLFQWIQMNSKIWYGNFTGLALPDLFSFYQNVDRLYDANLLSNVGLVVFSVGIYFVLKNNIKKADTNRIISDRIATKKLLVSYLIFSISLTLIYGFRNVIPGINTLLTTFLRLKWGLFVLGFIYSVKRGEERTLLIFIIIFEFLLGFTGYFSTFKNVIILTLLAWFMTVKSFNLNLIKIIQLAVIIVFVSFLGLGWTAIKSDYRDYVSNGGGQVVTVSKTQAFEKVFTLLSEIKKEDLYDSFDNALDRVSYIEFFSIALDHVPQKVPHENGDIFINSVSFFLKPRILFPDKEAIDDSAHTNMYTGLHVQGDGKASHSIGFMTDAYIDFGRFWMYFEILGLAIILSSGLKLILSKSKNPTIGLVLIVPFYFLLNIYSFNLIKVFGSFITYFVPIFVLRNKLNDVLLFFNSKLET